MKRIVLTLLIIAFAGTGLVADESDFYPVSLEVVKVFSHAEGYRVLYRSGYADVFDTYLPIRWFSQAKDSGGKVLAPRADIVRGEDPSFPYMVVFYKGGKFDHLRLFVKDNLKDPTWGVLPPGEAGGKFAADDLQLKF